MYHNICRDNLLLAPGVAGFTGSVRAAIATAPVEGGAIIEGAAASARMSSNLGMGTNYRLLLIFT